MRATKPDPGDRARSAPNTERIARAWAKSIAGTSFVSMNRKETHTYLTDLVGSLLAAVAAETFEAARGAAVGAALVEAHYTQPLSLDRTIETLGEQFDTAGEPARVRALLSALAAGYAQALRDRTLSEQEEIRAAAMFARTEAEAARWASEARFQAVFAGAVIGIGIADISGKIVDINRTVCDMLGYTPEEFRQLTVEEFIHPDDAPGAWDAYKEMVRGERDHFRLEKPYYRRDGTGGLDRPRGVTDPRPGRRPEVHRRDGRGHHRAARAPDPAAPPGPARPADPTAQPDAVLRAARRRSSTTPRTTPGSASATSTSTASR